MGGERGRGTDEHEAQLLCNSQSIRALKAHGSERAHALQAPALAPRLNLLSEVLTAPRKVATVLLEQADLLGDVPESR